MAHTFEDLLQFVKNGQVTVSPNQIIIIIPEQFTVEAHPALFEGGRGRGKKVSTNTFIPVYIHIHICTKACFQNLGGCRSLHIVYIHI